MRSAVALIVGLLIATCSHGIRVTHAPVTIGPVPSVFEPRDGLPLRGPKNEIRVLLGHDVDVPKARFELHASLILPDGQRRPLPLYEATSGRGGVTLWYFEWVKPMSPGTARGVELSAASPTQVQSIEWRSGRPWAGP